MDTSPRRINNALFVLACMALIAPTTPAAAEDVDQATDQKGRHADKVTGAANSDAPKPMVTIQAQLLDDQAEPLLSPVVTLRIGQRCDLSIMNSHTNARGSEALSLSLHILSVEGPFYKVRIEADDSDHDNPWTFETVTYLRAEEPVRFKWSAGDDGGYRTLELVLFDPVIIDEQEGEQVEREDKTEGETV